MAATRAARRHAPNLLVCGTPGVGKSRLCAALAPQLDSTHARDHYSIVNLSELVRERQCVESRDEQLECDVIDEKKLSRVLRRLSDSNAYVFDAHCVHVFPKRFFDLVFVIRCDNRVLFDRLSAREYSEEKLKNNIESEIFDVIGEEADERFGDHAVVTRLVNETDEQLRQNVRTIVSTVEQWIRDNK